MNVKRTLCCLFAVVCCLPILSAMAQDSTPVVPTADATNVTSETGGIGSATQIATQDASMMGTSEPGMMSTMEVMMTPDDPNTQTIGDIIAFQAGLETPEFTMLHQALQDTGLLETLMDNNSNYILFAPTDAAFMAIPEDARAALMSDPAALRAALLNHVVSSDIGMMATMEPGMMATQDMMATAEPGMMATMEPGMMGCSTMEPGMMATQDMMATAEPGMMATQDMMMGTMEPGMNWPENTASLGGLNINFHDYDGCMSVNNVRVIGKIDASNGRIYVIDSVLMADESGMMGTMEPGMMATQDMMATAEATQQP